jgi:myo-inositol-1(or 4)-monophosphatase
MTAWDRDLQLRYRFAQSIVREAGQLAAERFRGRAVVKIERKGRQDYVSEADRQCEDYLVGALSSAFPADAILGEEGGLRNDGGGPTWVIDPIDGTSNFIGGFPIWCVSLGLVAERRSVLGIIYNPIAEELYSAMAGGGATLNGRPIRASNTKRLDEARMGLGFSYRRPVEEHVVAVKACLDAHCEYVRFGSGALGMAYVADGRLDGYYEAHINAWDVAAGLAIVEEAGGQANDFFAPPEAMAGGNLILASTPGLQPTLESLLLRRG